MVKLGVFKQPFHFLRNGHSQNNKKKTIDMSPRFENSRALGGTSRVILELNPFGISIRGSNGSEPWVGRNTGKMSRNSTM